MFQMASIPTSLMSSGSKKKEPGYVCLSEAKTSYRNGSYGRGYGFNGPGFESQ
jgi:hypothetical protein